MRFIWLCFVGLAAYVIAVLAFFPAAPVVDWIRPQLGPVAIQGVSGKLYAGQMDTVRSTDDLLPVEFSNVSWRIDPRTLLKGGAGIRFGFDAYGGDGNGLITRRWDGSIAVSELTFNADAKQLEPLLPVPIATFRGDLSGDIESIVVVNELLQQFEGVLNWRDGALESPVPTALGNVIVAVQPEGQQTHQVSLSSSGGDIVMEGRVTVSLNGDFAADVLFTPASTASPAVINGLRQMGRPDAQGRVRLQRQGNLNRMM
ncbi:MAG: type II secretion system protein N [Gammaproteobacteria bacterium]|nr:type II secretion system protein N [Gammaproteobacteria bacterium]